MTFVNYSMLSIQEELGQIPIPLNGTKDMDVVALNEQQSHQQQQCYVDESGVSGINNNINNNNNSHADVGPLNCNGTGKPIGWMDGIFGCMRPVLSLIGKGHIIEIKTKQTEEWEIPFEIITDLEWLGSGAQGAVFSGKIRNEIVAVKKVRDVRETEIKHLRKLDHENIVKFKGICTQAPVFCIVMEFCPYGPLHTILKDGAKVITPARIVSWSKQIALGMQYLHAHKIIHRDLKSPK